MNSLWTLCWFGSIFICSILAYIQGKRDERSKWLEEVFLQVKLNVNQWRQDQAAAPTERLRAAACVSEEITAKSDERNNEAAHDTQRSPGTPVPEAKRSKFMGFHK